MFGRVLIVGVTAIFFIVRQVAKFLGLSAWGADDWTLILGYVCFGSGFRLAALKQHAYLQRQLFTLSFAVSKFYGTYQRSCRNLKFIFCVRVRSKVTDTEQDMSWESGGTSGPYPTTRSTDSCE